MHALIFSNLVLFLSTLSLRRATKPRRLKSRRCVFLSTLSLRRATPGSTTLTFPGFDFYPRSPCGERPTTGILILNPFDFYPRSPCGERLISIALLILPIRFLSTLSLRRATQTKAFKVSPLCISIHALLAESDAF